MKKPMVSAAMLIAMMMFSNTEAIANSIFKFNIHARCVKGEYSLVVYTSDDSSHPKTVWKCDDTNHCRVKPDNPLDQELLLDNSALSQGTGAVYKIDLTDWDDGTELTLNLVATDSANRIVAETTYSNNTDPNKDSPYSRVWNKNEPTPGKSGLVNIRAGMLPGPNALPEGGDRSVFITIGSDDLIKTANQTKP